MRASANPARLAMMVAAAYLLVGAGCSPPAGPGPAPSGGACRDVECPPGEECDGTGCVPVRPTLYPHIQLASVLFRTHVDDSEVEWRATHADLAIGHTVVQADRMRAANPDVRLFEYSIVRYNYYPADAEEWAARNGRPYENFMLHYREDVEVPGYESIVIVPGSPPGVVPGWNPDWAPGDPPASATEREQSRAVGLPRSGGPVDMADITNTDYRRFLIEQMERLADGTMYGAVNATGPVDGIMVDLGVWYPIFNEGVINKTSEFYGLVLDDSHPYAQGFITFYPELAEGLESRMARPIDIMPNFTDAFWLANPDALSQGTLAVTDWAWAEVWIMFRGNSSPTSGSGRAITYEQDYHTMVVNTVWQTRQGGRRVLGARDVMLAPAGSDRGRLFTLALYYLVHNPNTFYQYESYASHMYPVDISEWQWNPAVACDVGRPDRVPAGLADFDGNAGTTEHYEFASGPDPFDPALTYHVLARRFTKALVLVKMLPRGSVVDDRSITVHALDRPYKVLHSDGTLSAETVTSVSLRNNEGVILVLP